MRWPKHYPWIELDGYHYFRNRLSQARRDVENGLTITLDYFSSYEQQQHALRILPDVSPTDWSNTDIVVDNYKLALIITKEEVLF
jgi:pyrroloquinoline-quinone synthase